VLDLTKTIIQSLLSWPVAILILACIFRKQLKSLVDRIDLFKAPGIEVSAPTGSANKQKIEADKKSVEDPLGIGSIQTQLELPIPAEIKSRQAAVSTYGGDEPILLEQMKLIEDDLATLHFPLTSLDTSYVLIRHLAVNQILVRMERIYRLIFGSQITVLRTLNESGPQPADSLSILFDKAKSKAPKFFGEYTFRDWIDFLLKQNTIVELADGKYGISVLGQEFLKWVTATGVPRKLH
jgi:hypothetical protein